MPQEKRYVGKKKPAEEPVPDATKPADAKTAKPEAKTKGQKEAPKEEVKKGNNKSTRR